ncbi:MAG: hypothetical protein JRJ85_07455 [Deltaproteobacteria bacterium]|nr:hypothetical protein [Deltaproteobacteria bacterium]
MTTRPSRRTARSIMSLGFDEGAAGGRGGFLGFRGIRDGVAWYPGLLASAGLGWSSPLLGVAAKIIYRRKGAL